LPAKSSIGPPNIEGSVIVPAALAGTMAYCLFGMRFGWTPFLALLSGVETLIFHDFRHLAVNSMLAFEMILQAAVFKRTFYGIMAPFRQWAIPPTSNRRWVWLSIFCSSKRFWESWSPVMALSSPL